MVTLDVGQNEVKQILVNNESSIDICFEHTWDMLKLDNQVLDQCTDETPLYGFGNNVVPIAGVATLPVYFDKKPKQAFDLVRFYVINIASSYNMFLGSPILNTFRAITSTTHLKIKFPTPTGIGEIKGDLETSKKCYGIAMALAPRNRATLGGRRR